MRTSYECSYQFQSILSGNHGCRIAFVCKCQGAAGIYAGYTGQSRASVAIVQDTISSNQEAILIDLLSNSLQSLANRDRQGRMVGGYVLVGLGIGSAVGGAVTLAAGESDDARIVGYSLLGGGALLSGLSLVPFKVKTESEQMYAEFNRDLGEKSNQNRQKFYYWDRRFEELAEKAEEDALSVASPQFWRAG